MSISACNAWKEMNFGKENREKLLELVERNEIFLRWQSYVLFILSPHFTGIPIDIFD